MFNRKLFSNQQFVAVLVGLLVGIFGCFLVAYRGTDDTESLLKSEQNQGAEYRTTRNPGVNSPIGIARVAGVPVWDQTQGLGQRMPNLFGQQTQSPFIFMNKLASVELVTLVRLIFSTLLGLTLVNLAVASWGGKKIVCRLFLLDLSLLGPLFLYTVPNDFFVEADQYWGLCLIISGMCHVSLFCETALVEKSFSEISFYSLLFGTSFLFIGHPTWFIIGFLSLLLLIPTNLIKRLKSLGKLKLLALFITSFVLPGVQVGELALSRSDSLSKSYLAQPSTWDFFSSEPWVYKFQPILVVLASALQPVLRVVDEAGDRTEFFNSSLLVVAVALLYMQQNKSRLILIFLKRVYFACFILIVGLLTFDAISRARVPIISRVLTFNVWRLSHALFVLISITAVLILGQLRSSQKFESLKKTKNLVLFGVILVSLLYPSVMITKDVKNSDYSLFRDSSVRKSAKDLVKSSNIRHGVRTVLLGGELRSEVFAQSFLSRGGYPTLDFFSAGREINTFTINTEQFRTGFSLDTKYCDPLIFDFLSVGNIILDATGQDSCTESLNTYFGPSKIREQSKNEIKLSESSFFWPQNFKTWFVPTRLIRSRDVVCPLFEKSCFSGLESFQSKSSSQEAPFRLCEAGCLFRYRWESSDALNEKSRFVLLPVNFDSTLKVVSTTTRDSLKTEDFQGLLAVEVIGNIGRGEFEVSVRPDTMIVLRVLTTYMHTLVFLGCLLSLMFSGFRRLKNFDQQVKTGDRN